MARTADPEQLTGEVIQLGTVAAVDYVAATCTVTIGDLVTGELPWFAWSAGGVRIWAAPTPGEQGAVLCPEGDLDNGLFLPGIYSDAFAPPSNDPNVVHIQMPDGAFIAYNHSSHMLSVTLPEGGTVTLDAPGGATINGDVTINGNVTIAGKADVSEDVVGGGISLKSHKHSAVAAGTAQSGGPV